MTQRGTIIITEDARSFRNDLSGIGEHVGPRSGPDRRTKEQKELFCFRRYAATLATKGLWRFPCTVSMGESPDFMIEFGGNGCRGLEVTEATTPRYQRLLTEIDRDKPQSCALDDGWLGDAPERAWCDAVIGAIDMKVEKLGAYREADRHDILIYSNDQTDIVRGLNGRSLRYIMLREFIAKRTALWKMRPRLGIVSVLDGQNLLYDLTERFDVWAITSP